MGDAAAAQPAQNHRAIIVLGMHRSGTSAFTGLLSLLGADLGPSLLAASSANEAGYWEHGKVVAIHERLLLELGSSWDDVSRLPGGWAHSDAVAPFRAQLLDILARDFAASKIWTLKDPRICRLIPLWTSLLAELHCDPVWVLMTRHPLENIRSLEKRDAFSPQKSELLWLQHTLDAERETRSAPRVIATFDQLLEDWAATVERVRSVVGLSWPVPPEQAAPRVGEFIDPSKRHHRALDASSLSPWTRATYDALLAGAAGDDAAMRARLDPVHAAFDTADSLFQPILRDRSRELDQQLSEANSTVARLLDENAFLKAAHQEDREKIADHSRDLRTKKEQLQRFEHSLGGRLNRFLRKFRKRSEPDADSLALDFPAPSEGRPDASIIINAGHDSARLERCLRALRDHIAGRSVEVLAVGDDSAILPLRHCRNLGTLSTGKAPSFAKGHNRAGQKARGAILIFLQDRVSPADGWLDALLDSLRGDPAIGIAGPEAGLLKPDGSTEMLPRPSEPREADFCSLACLAISKNLFFQVGGFDGYYLPVEEASFGLKVRRTGHKVWQIPACRIVHHASPPRFDPVRFESNRKRFLQRTQNAGSTPE